MRPAEAGKASEGPWTAGGPKSQDLEKTFNKDGVCCIARTINKFAANDSPTLRGDDEEDTHGDEDNRTTAKRNNKPGRPPVWPHGRPSSGLSMANACLLSNANYTNLRRLKETSSQHKFMLAAYICPPPFPPITMLKCRRRARRNEKKK